MLKTEYETTVMVLGFSHDLNSDQPSPYEIRVDVLYTVEHSQVCSLFAPRLQLPCTAFPARCGHCYREGVCPLPLATYVCPLLVCHVL